MGDLDKKSQPEVPADTAAAAEREPARQRRVLACPKCGSEDVRPSYPRGFFDSVLVQLGRAPFRCRSCWARFHLYSPESLDAMERARVEGKTPR